VAYRTVYDDEGGQTSARFLAEAAAFFADPRGAAGAALTTTPRPTPTRSSSPPPLPS
jgi:hypothetical protein